MVAGLPGRAPGLRGALHPPRRRHRALDPPPGLNRATSEAAIPDPLLLLAAATFAAAALLAAELARGVRAMPDVAREPPVRPEHAPRVSIIVAARDEAAHVAAAIGTLLAQDYPALELIVVDDRSADGTGPILDRIAERRRDGGGGGGGGELRVIHVSELPAGWLGKTHALHVGAAAATGELLLFTDADVMLRPDALARAVALLRRLGVDHLAVAPRIRAGSPWASITVAVFLVAFSIAFRPWKAVDPDSRHHIGVGAFNLVRAPAYRAIGGHRSVALRPDDDLRLGRRLKEGGWRQAAARGRDVAGVDWYPSLRAMAKGLRKNSFAVLDYRLGLVALATLLPVLLDFWPVVALAVTGGVTRWLNAGVVVIGVLSTWDTARRHGLPAWVAPAHPLGAACLLWIVWSAALRTLASGEVEWRGTRYRLDQLRGG